MNKNIIFLWVLLIAPNNSNACWAWLCGGDSVDVARSEAQIAYPISIAHQAIVVQEPMHQAQELVHQVQEPVYQVQVPVNPAVVAQEPARLVNQTPQLNPDLGQNAALFEVIPVDNLGTIGSSRNSSSVSSDDGNNREFSSMSSDEIAGIVFARRGEDLRRTRNISVGLDTRLASRIDEETTQRELSALVPFVHSYSEIELQGAESIEQADVQAERVQSNSFVLDGGADAGIIPNAFSFNFTRENNSQAWLSETDSLARTTPNNVVHVVVTDTSAPRRDGDVLYLPYETNPCFQDGQMFTPRCQDTLN